MWLNHIIQQDSGLTICTVFKISSLTLKQDHTRDYTVYEPCRILLQTVNSRYHSVVISGISQHWPFRCVLPLSAGWTASIQIGQDVTVIDRLRQDGAPLLVVLSPVDVQRLQRAVWAPETGTRRKNKLRDSSGRWNWTPALHMKHYLFHRKAENKKKTQHDTFVFTWTEKQIQQWFIVPNASLFRWLSQISCVGLTCFHLFLHCYSKKDSFDFFL